MSNRFAALLDGARAIEADDSASLCEALHAAPATPFFPKGVLSREIKSVVRARMMAGRISGTIAAVGYRALRFG